MTAVTASVSLGSGRVRRARRFERPVRGSRWADAQARDALLPIIEMLAAVTGFDVIGVSAVRDDGYLHLLSVVGPAEAREALVDTLAPADLLVDALESADDWGALKWVPHDRHQLDIDRWGWTSDLPREGAPGAWHPEDILVATMHRPDGTLRGVLGFDSPRDGQVPLGADRLLLEHVRRPGLPRDRGDPRPGGPGRGDPAGQRRGRHRPPRERVDVRRRGARRVRAGHRRRLPRGGAVDPARRRGPRAVHDDAPVRPPTAMVDVLQRYVATAWATQSVGVFAPDRPAPPR